MLCCCCCFVAGLPFALKQDHVLPTSKISPHSSKQQQSKDHVCPQAHKSLMCYLTLMPLLLWPMSGWASPFLSVVIAFLLLGVENIGAYIEEPFHVSCYCSVRGCRLPFKSMAAARRQCMHEHFTLAPRCSTLTLSAVGSA